MRSKRCPSAHPLVSRQNSAFPPRQRRIRPFHQLNQLDKNAIGLSFDVRAVKIGAYESSSPAFDCGYLLFFLVSIEAKANPPECNVNHPYNRLLWEPGAALARRANGSNGGITRSLIRRPGRHFWSYGVINPKDPENLTGHADAFVSFGDFTQKFIVENRFPIKDFSGSSESSAISIGPNYSDGEVMRGSIKTRTTRFLGICECNATGVSMR